MGKNVQVVIVFFLFLFLISFTSAIEPLTQNESAQVRFPVRLGGGVAPIGTLCNFTMLYPNNTYLINFQPMTRLTDEYSFNLTGTQTSQAGVYDSQVTCNFGGLNDTLSTSIIINPGGIEPSQQRTDTLSRTIWFFFGLGVFCFISAMFVKSKPVKITLFLFMVWFLLMGTNTSLIAMQDEVINPKIQTFFEFFLTLSFMANNFIIYGVGILWIIVFFTTFKDKLKFKKSERYDYG